MNTNNTRAYRGKRGAVFLAAVLLFSVVVVSAAFAGGAAAQDVDGDRSIEDDTLAPGESTNVTVTVSLDGAQSFDLVESFDPAFADASVVDADGAAFSGANANEAFASYNDQSDVSFVYEVTAPQIDGAISEFDISSDLSGADVDAGTSTITVVDEEAIQAERTIEDDVLTVGETTNVTVTVSLDEAQSFNLVEGFDPAFGDASVVDADDAEFAGANANEAFASYNDRTDVSFVYEVEVDSVGTYEISSVFDQANVDAGTSTITVTNDETIQGDRTVEDDALAPGESTNVTVTVSLDEEQSFDLVENFDPAFGDANIVDADGAEFSGASANEAFATYDNRTDVSLVYEVTVPDDETAIGQTHEISSNVDDADVFAPAVTIEVFDPANANVTFNDQATASSTFTDENLTAPGVVVESVNSTVDSAVVVTYQNESTGDLVIAGLGTFTAEELDGGSVTIPVEDAGGFPGEHTAHVIPTDELSSQYAPGDTVSAETADAVLANDAATVFQGIVEFDDQAYEDATTEVVASVAALAGDDDALYTVNLHATDENGAPAEYVGSSPVLNGTNENVPIVLQDPNGEDVVINGTDDYVAMIHIVDDESAELGDLFPPATFPVLPHADAEAGFVPGGVTDPGEVAIFSAEGAALTFDRQGLELADNGDIVVQVDEIVEAEQIQQDVSDPAEDFVVLYEGDQLTQESLVDFRNIGDADENGELRLDADDIDETGNYTVEIYADARSSFEPEAYDIDHPYITDQRTDGASTDETEYILMLEDDLSVPTTTDTQTVVDELKTQAEQAQAPVIEELQSMGVSVDNQFWIVNALTTTVDSDSVSAADLEAIAGVDHVVENVEYQLPTPAGDGGGVGAQDVGTYDQHNYTYGLQQIDVPNFEETFGTQGDGSTVAILDNGISTPENPHPDLDIAIGAIAENGTVTTGTLGDPGAHGEHVAGTATGAANPAGDVPRYGVAPEADLYKINVFQNGAFTADILAAIEWSVDNDADVASMSLGFPPVDGLSPVQTPMEAAMQNANDAGTVVVGSAGNEGSGAAGGPVTSPGAEFSGFSIGASNVERGIASFSSGSVVTPNTAFVFNATFALAPYPEHYPREYVKPDVSAPGVNVLSSGPLGGDVTEGPPAYSFASGTSMAAPHAAGSIALIQAATDTEYHPKTIENALAETAEKPAGAPGAVGERDIRYGTGIINVTAATMALQETTTISGTVTDAETGDTLTGAKITTDTGVVTSTQDGDYSMEVTTTDVDSFEVTIDEFGYTAETQTVTLDGAETLDEQIDVALDPEVDVDPVVGQPVWTEYVDQFNIVADVRNVEEYTVELVSDDITEDNLTVSIAGQEVEFGETLEFDEPVSTNGVPVTVETDGTFNEGDAFALDHTFGGPGDDIQVTTGPTKLTEEQAPANFVLSDFAAPDGQQLGQAEPYAVSVNVTNAGQIPGEAEIRWFLGPLGLVGDNPVVDLQPGETEEVILNFGEIDVGGFFGDAPVSLLHGFDAAPAAETASGDTAYDTFTVGDGSIPLLAPIDGGQPRDAAQTAEIVAPDVTGDGNPALDTSGDSLLNDVDGDREFSIFDVQAFFNNFNEPIVQDNEEFFDFNDDGEVDIFDVQSLFDQLGAESAG